MRISVLLLVIIFPIIINAQAPSWQWAKSAGGTNSDVSRDIVTDKDGNVYVIGHFKSSSITFGTTTLNNVSSSTDDMFIAKYDLSGNVLWAKKAGGSNGDFGLSVSVDDSGYVYVSGYFKSSSITFGSYTLNNPGTPYGTAFLVKYDGLGNVIWAKSSSNSPSSDTFQSVITDSKGNVYVTGHFQSSSITFGATTLTNSNPSLMEPIVVKYDNLGNVVWAKNGLGNSHDRGYDVSVDTSGNVYFTGTFESTSVTFGNIILNNSGSQNEDVFVVKYDEFGNVLWAKSAGGSHEDFGFSVSVDNNENLYLAGYSRSSSITFGTNTLTNSGTPYGDLFIVKYNSLGNVLWAKKGLNTLSSDAFNSVYADNAGNVYATGHFQSNSITFGSTTLTNSNSPNQEIVIVKYDSMGNELWALNTSGLSNDVGKAIYSDNNGNLYVSGDFSSSSVNFGSIVLNNNGVGNGDIYIAKFENTSLGVHEQSISSNIVNIYPNPTNSTITVNIENKESVNGYKIEINNLLGQTVYTNSINSTNNSIDLSSLGNKGNYFVKVLDENNNLIDVQKVIYH
jgi:hypothetical protein